MNMVLADIDRFTSVNASMESGIALSVNLALDTLALCGLSRMNGTLIFVFAHNNFPLPPVSTHIPLEAASGSGLTFFASLVDEISM